MISYQKFRISWSLTVTWQRLLLANPTSSIVRVSTCFGCVLTTWPNTFSWWPALRFPISKDAFTEKHFYSFHMFCTMLVTRSLLIWWTNVIKAFQPYAISRKFSQTVYQYSCYIHLTTHISYFGCLVYQVFHEKCKTLHHGSNSVFNLSPQKAGRINKPTDNWKVKSIIKPCLGTSG